MRVGTDVLSIAEVNDALRSFGTKYTERVFTAAEVSTCGGPHVAAAPGLAARFAAKEAVVKALRMTEPPPDLREIEVVRAPWGGCELRLHGDAARHAAANGLTSWDVSISHDAGVALATVIAYGGPVESQPVPAQKGGQS